MKTFYRNLIWLSIWLTIIFIPILGHGQSQNQFDLLPSSHTGITFKNEVKDTKESNILIYSNFYGGAGVGIGDFNNDGLQDIFFAGNQVNDRLFVNTGNLKFQDVTKSAGIQDNGGWSSGVLIGDINNDGWQDIYVTRELYDGNPELRKNKLYINTTKSNPNNSTTFKESASSYGLDNSERTRHAAFLDFNKDGHLDLFLLNQPPNPGNFSEMYGADLANEKFAPRLYKNNRNNTFTDVTSTAGLLRPGFANSVSVFDANNDGWQDIYITNDFDAPDFFYLNNGDSTFSKITDESMRHISYFSMGVDTGDVNNDGNLDLMVVDMVAEDNFRLKSNMSGMDPKSFWNIVAKGGHYQYMFNSLQINQGNYSGVPHFGDVAQLAGVPSTDWSWSNIIADFDNDGYKDIYVTNGLLRDIRNTDSDKAVSRYINQVANDFVQNNPNAGDVTIWDILDLDKALGHIPSAKLSNYAYKNQDGLTFVKSSNQWGLDQKTFSSGCAYGDLDNDGDLDLVVNNVNDLAFIYRNNSDKKSKQNYLRVALTNKEDNSSMFGARVEAIQGKNKQLYEFTSVRGMYSSSEQIAHFGFEEKGMIDTLRVIWPNRSISIFMDIPTNEILSYDYNEAPKVQETGITSGKPLFTEANIVVHEHEENEFNDFDKQVLLPHKQSQLGPALATGDVNNDGLEDFFIGGSVGHEPVLFLQNGDGTFKKSMSETWAEASKYEDIDAQFADIDNDGDLDLYVVSGGNEWEPNNEKYQDRLYLNDGNGLFVYAKNKLPRFTESGSMVKPFDYDNDGDLDLFIGGRHRPWDYPSPVSSRILNNSKGSFKDVTKSVARELFNIGMVTDAEWIDFDNDGLTDLVLVGEWMPITFFKNTGNKFKNVTQETGLSNTEGWWYSLASADMDNDGDQDLIAGNLGLNYKYKASKTAPFEVHYKDFDENGSKDIVLSYYNFGEQFPLRGRSCSSQQVPIIAQQFKTYDVFASANLEEVYGQNNLQTALHYKAKTFASSYLENLGNSKFKLTELPKEAQVSNIDDILINDFDGDGNKDFLIAGNMYPAEVETTRNDAGVGLLLKGNGKGDFQPVMSAESGLFLKGDIQHMALINLIDGQMVIGAANNDTLKIFKINAKVRPDEE